MKHLKLLFIFTFIFTVACTMKGKVEGKDKTISCTDIRDGEKFSYKSSSMKNIRIGFLGADTCADITLLDGSNRTICKSHEVYTKCIAK